MVGALAGGEQPYPEPVQPPDAPPETPPIDTPREEPPATPFNDGGRPVDLRPRSHPSIPLPGGELVA